MLMTANIPRCVVHRYAETHNMRETEAVREFDELIKFLKTCASVTERCAPSEALDKVWHEFMQFTLEYQEFCLSNFGRVINHDPSPRERNIGPYLRTRETAQEMFGELDLFFWPIGAAGATCCGATTDKIIAN